MHGFKYNRLIKLNANTYIICVIDLIDKLAILNYICFNNSFTFNSLQVQCILYYKT